ncbi:universal stress protein [Halogeometricum borinquense]|uniref:Universal stress protein n=1 Tax=Halogeometricum borinquense TaxID=60847 RepID=A0A6C0UKA8_9EURY|nr:universal stress protein [Halogeometricum borinquense]QIB74761.1 universal stress protein [Halogeometricum borinquense]QIQ76293.1 universal stress protein [Halogeometricum borinquense]
MYERILVPTDGSDLSSAAARHAFDLAQQYDATVHALYVVETDTGWLTVSKNDVRETLRELGEKASKQAFRDVERIAATTQAEVVTDVLEGTPEEQILQYTDENDIDLIVMGTHGHSGLERRLVGSVTNRVVRGADVPVMAVNAPSESED